MNLGSMTSYELWEYNFWISNFQDFFGLILCIKNKFFKNLFKEYFLTIILHLTVIFQKKYWQLFFKYILTVIFQILFDSFFQLYFDRYFSNIFWPLISNYLKFLPLIYPRLVRILTKYKQNIFFALKSSKSSRRWNSNRFFQ